MAEGNRRIVQEEFSAGAFPGTSFEQIPSNGLVDAVNFLVDDDRSLLMRGGSAWAAPAIGAGSTVPWMWSGVIGSTNRTIVASASGVAASDDQAGTTSATIAVGTVPSRGPAVSFAGLLFLPNGSTINSALAVGSAALSRDFYAVAGNRLWAADYPATRVDFSDVGTPGTFGATSFHQIAEGGILGLMGLRDALVVFTTAGVWVISNVGANLTDPDGNVQHRIDRYSRDLILWNANGLGAAFEGALVVPARDGVYLLSYGVASEAPQQFTLISQPIGNLYREYVAAGHLPGQPTVYRNTLFLPIKSAAGAFVDLLVCRLDATNSRGARTFPWTRIDHEGTGPLTLTRSVFTGKLIGGGVGDDRLMRLDYFDSGGASTDADAQGWTTYFTARSPVSAASVATIAKFRLGYHLDGGGLIEAQYLDSEGGSQTLTGNATDNSANLEPYTWRVAKRARYSAMQVTYAAAADPFRVRSLEWFVRDRGRV